MRKKRYLDLDKFLRFHEDFINIPTWTSKKRNEYNILRGYMNSCRKSEIASSRDSDTTRVHCTNSFTIFKVSPGQRGTMKIYRDQWVLMYVSYRCKFQHFLEIFPLKKGIDKSFSQLLKNRLDYRYIDSISF